MTYDVRIGDVYYRNDWQNLEVVDISTKHAKVQNTSGQAYPWWKSLRNISKMKLISRKCNCTPSWVCKICASDKVPRASDDVCVTRTPDQQKWDKLIERSNRHE